MVSKQSNTNGESERTTCGIDNVVKYTLFDHLSCENLGQSMHFSTDP